jgi:hypothetical protein
LGLGEVFVVVVIFVVVLVVVIRNRTRNSGEGGESEEAGENEQRRNAFHERTPSAGAILVIGWNEGQTMQKRQTCCASSLLPTLPQRAR